MTNEREVQLNAVAEEKASLLASAKKSFVEKMAALYPMSEEDLVFLDDRMQELMADKCGMSYGKVVVEEPVEEEIGDACSEHSEGCPEGSHTVEVASEEPVE